MDKQLLVSSKALCDSRRYGVGILSNQELHITPLVQKHDWITNMTDTQTFFLISKESILTMRSSLDHLDKSDKAKRDISKTDMKTENVAGASQEEEDSSDLTVIITMI